MTIVQTCIALDKDLVTYTSHKMSQGHGEFFCSLLFYLNIIFKPTLDFVSNLIRQGSFGVVPQRLADCHRIARDCVHRLLTALRDVMEDWVELRFLNQPLRLKMGDRVPVRHPREILMQMIWQMRYEATVGIKGDRPEEEDLRRCLGK